MGFFIKKLLQCQKKYSLTELECLAFIKSVEYCISVGQISWVKFPLTIEMSYIQAFWVLAFDAKKPFLEPNF